MIQARYRRDYDGEFVLLETRIVNGKKVQKRDWIPNVVENYHISDRAACIGSRTDLDQFDFKRLQRHRGGLLGKKRLQTYGTGDLWQDMMFDFVTTNDRNQLQEIAKTDYADKSTVHTSARLCVEFSGRFYLIPFQPVLDELALNLYLAAFDGHKEIYMLGYNNDTPGKTSAWIGDINQVLAAYSDIKFILVGVESNMPAVWRNNKNVTCLTYNNFVSYCDV
jgi:hypothetical protein